MEKKERTYYTENLIESAIDELQERLEEIDSSTHKFLSKKMTL